MNVIILVSLVVFYLLYMMAYVVFYTIKPHRYDFWREHALPIIILITLFWFLVGVIL